MELEKYEDTVRETRSKVEEKFSPYCDFRIVKSTVTDGVEFAVRIVKPKKPSYLVAGTHGWHMSVKKFEYMETSGSDYLLVDVDMRGRAFSTGRPDCNGYELYDVYDAINFAIEEYSEYLLSDKIVYFESGSGGGGNALAMAGKFPDLFCAVNALTPIGDYAAWYEFDSEIKEFRDEMDIWIGRSPSEDPVAYKARGGVELVENLLSPVLIVHGTDDLRVPYFLSKDYVAAAERAGKGSLVKLLTLDGVGTRQHYGNITAEQTKEFDAARKENFEKHRIVSTISDRGKFAVGGYLVTKKFSVFLGSVDDFAEIEYDVKEKRITRLSGGRIAKTVWNDDVKGDFEYEKES